MTSFLPMLFQIAGSAIGAQYGYSALGGTIGAITGAALFGTQHGATEGPRLQDLKVQSSAYGTPIPITWGCVKLSGNLIWSSGIHETVRRETSGAGLLGGGATLTTYSYSVDLAIAICEGRVDEVRRIWANGRLVVDHTGQSARPVPEGFDYVLHAGGQDQAPDPYMVANRGGRDVGGGLGVDGLPVAGPVPAYQGTAYVLIRNLDLEPFGNAVPSFEFEVFRGQPTGATSVALGSIVADLCARAGLAPEDVDVTELTDRVRGYVVARPTTVRASIEQLASAFFFDGVETGGSDRPATGMPAPRAS